MINPSPAYATILQSNNDSAINFSGASLHVSALRKIVFWTVGAYIIFSNGFQVIRFPPVGPGIPAGELVLILCFCVISLLTLLPKMASEVWMLPILAWWGLSLTRCLIDTTVGGVWSFRDASQAIESLYLIVGFWSVNSKGNLQYFFKWIRKIFLMLALLGVLLPFRETLQAVTPHMSGIMAGSNSLFFSMTNIAPLLIWVACWLLLDNWQKNRASKSKVLLACLLVTFSVAYAQGRTQYLAVLGIGAMLLLLKRKLARKWALILFAGIVIIGVVAGSGLELKGARGHEISLSFMARHFQTITGTSKAGDVEASAGGATQRIGWWRHIYLQMKDSPQAMIMGLGYGRPLTNFSVGGSVQVREPHNSYISVVARVGISGMLVWLLMQASLYFSWWRSFQLCKRMQWTRDQNHLLLILIFDIILLMVAIGEDGFEKPFWAIPYYFFFGVVLRYGRQLRETAARQVSVNA
jgi:O-antigen ligase